MLSDPASTENTVVFDLLSCIVDVKCLGLSHESRERSLESPNLGLYLPSSIQHKFQGQTHFFDQIIRLSDTYTIFKLQPAIDISVPKSAPHPLIIFHNMPSKICYLASPAVKRRPSISQCETAPVDTQPKNLPAKSSSLQKNTRRI